MNGLKYESERCYFYWSECNFSKNLPIYKWIYYMNLIMKRKKYPIHYLLLLFKYLCFIKYVNSLVLDVFSSICYVYKMQYIIIQKQTFRRSSLLTCFSSLSIKFSVTEAYFILVPLNLHQDIFNLLVGFLYHVPIIMMTILKRIFH